MYHMEPHQIEDLPTSYHNLFPELEVFVMGDENGADLTYETMYKSIFSQLGGYHEKARQYLKSYNMDLNMSESFWTLNSATFGKVTFIDGTVVNGFSLLYLYTPPNEEVYNCFQIKVNFKENGWPIGFECGPEF